MVTIKPEIMKQIIFVFAAVALLLCPCSCNKEEPGPTSAAFTTNLQNNTATAGKSITFYTSEATGEFLTYFKGDKPENSYGTGKGTLLELGTDSLLLTYYNAGEYTFTLVATSYGNWSETVSRDIDSVNITIVAAR